jgi:hypothetical protein
MNTKTPMNTKKCLVLFMMLWCGSVAGQTVLPTLPQTYIDTTYSAPTGATCTAANSAAFQTCLNNAALNSTIVLQAGTTYTGPFRLPNKTSGSGWIYIVSSNLASLPAVGTRVSPSSAVNMPKIIATTLGDSVVTDRGAHHYRFVGVEFTNAAGQNVYNTISLGLHHNGSYSPATSLGHLPTDITFDRCYIHGDPSKTNSGFDIRGVSMDGIRVAVIDSYISDFKAVAMDSQGLWAFNSPGPFKIVNNFIEGAGMSIMFGGNDPAIANTVPSDIEIRRNHFFKRLSWQGSVWVVKNHFEIKNARRVLLEGNIFENQWNAAQQTSVIFTPRNQDGSAPWSTAEDITFRLNKFINTYQGVGILGQDWPNTSAVANRILVENNLIVASGPRAMNFSDGPVNVTIKNNTIVNSGSELSRSSGSPKGDGLDFKNNIGFVGTSGFGFTGDGQLPGINTLNTYFTNWSWDKNAFYGPTSFTNYPATTYFPANIAAVGFVDYANGNYRLAPSSPYKNAGTDGEDLGADIDAIEAAIAGGGGGDTTSPSVTISTADPSNITADSLTVIGTASDAVGVSGCKWRRASVPDASNGTVCTGTTSFSCATSGYMEGANTLYVGCYDAAGNYGHDSMIVNLDSVLPEAPVLSALLPVSGTKLAKEATDVTIGVTSDIAATCRWGNLPGLQWANLTAYTTTGGTSHSSSLAVVAGGVYQVCSRCYNAVAELFSGDSCTSFSVIPKPKSWLWR